MTRPRILFVDDEPNILHGLQRMLRGMREQWDMHFVASGREALAKLAEQPWDAVVSDMCMPEMDGAELLNEVRRRHPGVVRLILSAYSDQELVMRSAGPSHQFLSKPCSSQVLTGTILRSLELRRMLESAELRSLLAGLKGLPSPSDTYHALVRYIELPHASANGVAEIVGRDVAMTAELLKLTNSANFGALARASSPLQAVRMLGFETVRALVLRIGIFRGFRGLAEADRVMDDLNRDSFLVARIARRIGKAEDFDAGEIECAFCAAMLSSVGLLFLIARLPDRWNAVRQAVAEGEDPLSAETRLLGANHLQLGAYLLGLWGFCQSVVEAVAFCGGPSLGAGAEMGPVGAVHVARVLAGPSPAYGGADNGRLPLDRGYLAKVQKSHRLPEWAFGAEAERQG